MTCELQFRPDAAAAYAGLRSDLANEAGKRVKAALELIRDDPGQAKGSSSRWESLDGKLWSLPVTMPDGSTWLVLWLTPKAEVAEVLYIGPARPASPLAPPGLPRAVDRRMRQTRPADR